MTSPVERVDAAPSKLAASQAPPLARRLACLVYEALLLFGLGLIPGVLGTIFFAQTRQQYPLQTDTALRAFAFIFYGIYFVWFWSTRGQTLAMQTWHIRVVTADGAKLSQARAALRFLAACVWFAPAAAISMLWQPTPLQSLMTFAAWALTYALLSLLQREHQFWHDVVCRTRLVDARVARSPR